MNNPPGKDTPPLFREAVIFSGLSFTAAFLTFVTQAVFSRNLATGEFGTLSAALGWVLLLGVPLSAVNQTFVHQLARFHVSDQHEEIERLKLFAFRLLKMTSLGTGIIAFIVLILFPRLFLSFRPLLQGAVLVTALTLLASTLSGALCLGLNRFRLWGVLTITAAILRLLLAIALTSHYPRAEMAMAITAVAWLVTSLPVCWRQRRGNSVLRGKVIFSKKETWLYLVASFSVMLALFLFSSGDQVVSQYCFGPKLQGTLPDAAATYDNYQAAGLLGRSLVWGSAPILAVIFTHVSREPYVNLPGTASFPVLAGKGDLHGRKTLQLLFLYAGTLLTGGTALFLFRRILTELFLAHDSTEVSRLLSLFVVAMIPLGMLQAVGILCLAARRLVECFVLGAGALIYTLFLRMSGHDPNHILASMFQGGCGVIFLLAIVHLSRRLVKQGRISIKK